MSIKKSFINLGSELDIFGQSGDGNPCLIAE